MIPHIRVTKKISRILHLGSAYLLLVLFSACAHYTIDDKPLAQWSPKLNKDVGSMIAGDRSSELLVLVRL